MGKSTKCVGVNFHKLTKLVQTIQVKRQRMTKAFKTPSLSCPHAKGNH